MKKIISILTLTLLLCLPALAEDGHSLWLRHTADGAASLRLADMPTAGKDISVSGAKASNPTIAIAIDELRRAGIPGPIRLSVKKDKKAAPGSYAIECDADGNATITAPDAIGILYGAYGLIRRHQLGQDYRSVKESPAFGLRVLDHWDNPDGTVERGYAGQSIWKWDELPDSVSPIYKEYARACASVGINAAVLNNVNAKPATLASDNLVKVKAIADELRPYGVQVFLSVNFASPKALGGLPTADPLDPAVQAWWRAIAAEIYRLIPDFGGFLVKANSEGEPGPGDYGRSHSQGANMLADAIAPYDGTIMWRAFVYNPSSPDRAMQAYDEFVPLDGEFRDNVIIQIKNGPVDFQPREPFSPLFGAMPKTAQMIEFQITQEYLGQSNHLVYLAPLFKECLDQQTYRGEGTVAAITAQPRAKGRTAIAGVANIGDDANWCGHDFAQANWYAFGRLAWDPSLSSEQIAEEWLRLTFSSDPAFVEPVKQMMLDSREACVNYMMPLGLHHIFAGNHHYGPEPWYYVPGIRLDWTPMYYHKADSLGLGFDRTVATGSGATAQYAEPLASLYENDCPPEYLLWFHHVGWNDQLPTGRTLWQELCHRFDLGMQQARGFQKTWDAAQPYVDPERFAAVQDKLKIQTHDAQWWHDACLLYFQEINGLPFPADTERPVYTLDALKKVRIPLGLYGCPTREMLP